MTVPARYILAAMAFGIAALGFFLLPVDASAECNGRCQRPPTCQHNCAPPSPPPCHSCQPPTVIVPPPHVPPPNIVVVNAGARASASANATAIAIANVRTGDTIIRQNMIVDGGGASAMVNSSAFAVTEASVSTETVARERDLLIQAICVDTSGNPHPASQTFGGRDVAQDYRGEIFRCMSGTRMRYTVGETSRDCATGEALWYENGQATCRPQIARRPCNERSLLRRFGPGDKLVRVRDTETRAARSETTFNGAMSMDGGVGQSVY
jgi:hypothetical protein